MAAQQIPRGKQGSRPGTRGIGDRARLRLFVPRSPARGMKLRRNGPVRVQFPSFAPDVLRGRRMRPAGTRHIPVLGREAVEWLAAKSGGIYVDATFGAGGYSRAILEVSGTRVIGIDRDRTAIAGGFDLVERSDGRLTLVEERFSQLLEICTAQGFSSVDGVVMDVGVSSMQLDEAEPRFFVSPRRSARHADGSRWSDRRRPDRQGVRGRSRRHYLCVRRRAPFPQPRPRDRRRAQPRADHDHAGARRHRRQGRARQAGRDSSSDAHVSGFKDFRQPRARRAATGAGGGRARAQAGRPAGRGIVSFAGRPHRQEFSCRSRQGCRRIAASARGRAGRTELCDPDPASGCAERSGNRRQSAGAFGKAARRRTHCKRRRMPRTPCHRGQNSPT